MKERKNILKLKFHEFYFSHKDFNKQYKEEIFGCGYFYEHSKKEV